MLKPSLELKLLKSYKHIIGVDEVGRGCIAGPVVAAAVCFFDWEEISGIKDSKKTSLKQREHLAQEIPKKAHIGVGIVEPQEIDRINILKASLFAMEKAILNMGKTPDYVLIDGIFRINLNVEQKTIPHGDSLCYSIAAASIVAKFFRDHLMKKYSESFPGYGFEKHVGYPTQFHLEVLKTKGITPIHRRTFKGVKEYVA